MTLKKTVGGLWATMNLKSAASNQRVIAACKTNVKRRTTEWKSSTILTSTRPSSVFHICRSRESASMESTALLRILKTTSPLTSLSSMFPTWTSTSFTSKPYGAPIKRMTMTGQYACTHTTGKITGGNPIYMSIVGKFALIGKIRTNSSHLTTTAVTKDIAVNLATVGKSRSTIQSTSKLNLATSRCV
jgi:hypothetical protein